jgi:hypothetical protein
MEDTPVQNGSGPSGSVPISLTGRRTDRVDGNTSRPLPVSLRRYSSVSITCHFEEQRYRT